MKKTECLPGTHVIVNEKVSKWNVSTGATKNGLVAFLFNPKGTRFGDEIEIQPGTKLELLSKPKRFNANGNQVKFKIDGDDRVFSAWWCCIMHKVDIVNEA